MWRICTQWCSEKCACSVYRMCRLKMVGFARASPWVRENVHCMSGSWWTDVTGVCCALFIGTQQDRRGLGPSLRHTTEEQWWAHIFIPITLLKYLQINTGCKSVLFLPLPLCQGIMLVYDITSEKSFENIKNWIRNIEEVSFESHYDIKSGSSKMCTN